jgi:hypothetical protein
MLATLTLWTAFGGTALAVLFRRLAKPPADLLPLEASVAEYPPMVDEPNPTPWFERDSERGDPLWTPELQASCEARATAWCERMASPEPGDRQRAEAAARHFYQLLGLPAPRIVWAPSPAACDGLLGEELLRADRPGWNPWQPRQGCCIVSAEDRIIYTNYLGRSLSNISPAQYRFVVWNAIAEQRWLQSIDVKHGNTLRHSLAACGWTWQQQCLRELRGLAPHAYHELPWHCSWWALYPDRAVLVERPVELRFDDRRRFHGADGPAMRYADGLEMWAWHGVLVPRHAIMAPASLRREEVLKEPNVETRRALISLYGPQRLLEESNAEVVHQDRDPHGPRTLYHLRIPDDEPLAMIKVQCIRKDSNVDTYFLRVPPSLRTCHEAVAWTFNVPAALYQPAAQS